MPFIAILVAASRYCSLDKARADVVENRLSRPSESAQEGVKQWSDSGPGSEPTENKRKTERFCVFKSGVRLVSLSWRGSQYNDAHLRRRFFGSRRQPDLLPNIVRNRLRSAEEALPFAL